MPSLNTRVPDITDIADDDVRQIPDLKTRDAVYRVTEKLKQIFEYQMEIIEVLYEAVTELEIDMSAQDP